METLGVLRIPDSGFGFPSEKSSESLQIFPYFVRKFFYSIKNSNSLLSIRFPVMDSVETVSLEEVRDWAELHCDVLSVIFQKLGITEVLLRAQGVCSSWMRLSYDPQLWRQIDMRNPSYLLDSEYDVEKMARAALDRSCGQCVKFSVGRFATNELLQYLIDK